MTTRTLPIDAHRDQIIRTVFENQVTIVVGETGSGKTTQLPQFFYNLPGLPEGNRVCITEPRRNAAISTAQFVAQQLDVQIGNEVAYQIRFDNRRSPNERICFMTTGILLQELQNDPDLNDYTIIIVDEAHERSIQSDTILGLLKQILDRGNRADDLRIIVASATIDAQKFSNFFNGAPIIEVSGRTYPVETHYDTEDYSCEPRVERVDGVKQILPPEYIEAMTARVTDICTRTSEGDILCFLPGHAEIEWANEAITSALPKMKVYRLHGDVPMEEQLAAINPSAERKIILSTNIAETSLTVDGVVYIVDSGFIKQNEFDRWSRINSLKVVEHSQAGCNQRSGRAGRTQPGVCYRLFTKENFQNRLAFTKPEIQRVNLENTILDLLSIGVRDIESFPFLDPPDRLTIHKAVVTLERLGAINNDQLTPLGEQMAFLPVDPQMAKMLIVAIRLGCLEEVLTIAAFLSTRKVYFIPKNKDELQIAKQMWKKVQDSRSDFLTYLKIWRLYMEAGEEDGETRGQWARRHFLNNKALREVGKIRHQLQNIMDDARVKMTSSQDADTIHKCILAGYHDNLMQASGRFTYNHLEAGTVFRHPGTVLFNSAEKLLFAVGVQKKGRQEFGEQKTFMDHVGPAKATWLPEICPEITTVNWDWNSLRLNQTTGKIQVNQVITFRSIWRFETETDLDNIKNLSDDDKAELFKTLIYQLAITAQSQISSANGHYFMASTYRRHADHEITEGLDFVNQFFQDLGVDISQGYVDLSENDLLKTIIKHFSIKLNQYCGDILRKREGTKVALLKEKLDDAKSIMNESDINLVRHFSNWRYNREIKAILQVYDNSFETLYRLCTNNLDSVSHVITEAKSNYSWIVQLAKSKQAELEEKQLQRRQLTENQLQLNQHVNEEYALCPVCNNEIDVDALRRGKTSCACTETSHQEKFACTGQEEVLIMRSMSSGVTVAELVAISDKDGLYQHELRIHDNRITLSHTEFEVTDYYEEPSTEQLDLYRRRHEIEAFHKEETKALRLVATGEAVRLTFIRGRNGRGEPQWQSQNGRNMFICDKQAKMQPSEDERTFYCTKGKPFGKTGKLNLVMATPFLSVP